MAGPRRQDLVVTIRQRLPADDDAILRLNDAAFGGTFESKLIADLRTARLAVIELVALAHDDIAGHILFSELAVQSDGRPVDTLALAPIAVRPDRQRAGIGTALVRAGLEAARSGKWRAVIVLGHPSYYPRFGFSAERARHLKAPFRGDAFMALEFVPGALDGAEVSVVYPPAFVVTPPPVPPPAG
jgi:putative acetyltransferase